MISVTGTYTNIRLNYDLDTQGGAVPNQQQTVPLQNYQPTATLVQQQNVNYVSQPLKPSVNNNRPQIYQPAPERPQIYQPDNRDSGQGNPSEDSICGASVTGAAALIKGGKKFRRGEFPWLTALFYDKEFICGGSIVSSRYCK